MINAEEQIRVREWARVNNCEIDENRVLHVFKAVHKVQTKNGPRYIADYCVRPYISHVEQCEYNWEEHWAVAPRTRSMKIVEYKIGETVWNDLDYNRNRICSVGLHCSTIGYARSYGLPWGDSCILELGIDTKDPMTDIVIPFEICLYSEPKIRTNKLTVIREVESTTGQWHPKTGSCFIFEDQEKAWHEVLKRIG